MFILAAAAIPRTKTTTLGISSNLQRIFFLSIYSSVDMLIDHLFMAQKIKLYERSRRTYII